MTITIGELKELLSDLPNDVNIYFVNDDGEHQVFIDIADVGYVNEHSCYVIRSI